MGAPVVDKYSKLSEKTLVTEADPFAQAAKTLCQQ